MRTLWALIAVVLVSCGGTKSLNQPGDDGGTADAGHDAGACVCSSVSTCCDGCLPRNNGMSCDDGLSCSASSACEAGACTQTTSTCAVTWPACQMRTCSETLGCGAVTNIREGFDCDDGNASTYDDACEAGACVGTPLACTVSNGGCTGAGVVCMGHDPAPPTCRCSSRYDVTASEVLDTTTGLTWERTPSAATFTHANALARCAGLGSGWRVPTSAELLGIHTGSSGPLPRIDVCAFPGTASTYFWASDAGTPSGYFQLVDFGGCCGSTNGMASATYPVRCVR